MPSKVLSATTIGLDSQSVEVEVDVLSAGMHVFTIVGLPDTAIKESRDRVSSAVKNSGFKPPHQCGRVTVNLAPADVPKMTPIYDIPVALGLLIATKQLSFDARDKLFVGELALDGMVRGVGGILPIALFAKASGVCELYVPHANAAEASVVSGIRIIPVDTLHSLAKHLSGTKLIEPYPTTEASELFGDTDSLLDMAHVKGQSHAKRALEIAAAGGHNILFNGPPGSGKTLLAKTLPSILPKLTLPESLEITKIFSIAGVLPKNKPLVVHRPFRTPHHSASAVSLVGGGTFPCPGEISLAHRGVLFLDEFAEFSKAVVEHLRQPLEDGVITVSRARGSYVFPARFMLVAAMNPCPCGNATDPEKVCSCPSSSVSKYQRRISGPILDRIDLHVEVPRLKFDALESKKTEETSAEIRVRVEKARQTQRLRFADCPIVTNSEMSSEMLRRFCPLDKPSKALLRNAISTLGLSARSYHRLIKIARTIADIAQSQEITSSHVAEAINYRFHTEV